MANVKITELTAATTLDGDDVFPVVDVSGDTTNKVSVTDLLRNVPDGTAAAPSIANTGDQDTGILFPAADTVAISTGGTQRFSVDGSGDVSISGSLTVSGTTTTIESTTLTVDDKNIELGTVATPSDTTADGGGITLKGATDKTINWVQSTGCWTFNQPMNFNDHVRIDSSGRLLVGTSSSRSVGAGSSFPAKLQIESSGFTNTSFVNNTNDEYGPEVNFGKSRGTSAGSNTVVQSGDQLGIIQFAGADGTDLETNGAAIECRVDGTPGSNDMPGRLVFSTTADGGSSPTERMRIDSSGNIGIGTTTAAPANGGGMSINGGSITRIDWRNSTTGDATGDGTSLQLNGNNFTIENRESGYVAVSTSLTERLRIDSSGNVGIGTSSPSRKLHLNSGSTDTAALFESSDADCQINFQDSTSSADGVSIGCRGDNFYVRSGLSTERMSITSSGVITTDSGFTTARLNVVNGSTVSTYDSMLLLRSNNLSNGYLGLGNDSFHISSGGNAPIVFHTNSDGGTSGSAIPSNERMRIDSSGRLLVGTTTEGAVNADTLTVAESGDSGITIRSGSTSAGSLFFSDSTSGVGEYAGYLQYDHNSNYLAIGTASTERMRIDSGGQVGIGTSSPSTRLEVVGNTTPQLKVGMANDADRASLMHNGSDLYLDTTAGGLIFRGASNTERMRIESTGIISLPDDTAIAWGSGSGRPSIKGNNSSDNLQFNVAGSERMRIDTSGNVFIACTTVPSSSVAGILLRGNASGSTYFSAGSATTAWNQIRFFNGNGQVGTIQTSGSTTFYNTSSDYRLKENVVDIADGIDRVKQLQPRRFNFIADADTTVDGFLAHEAQTVVPEAVTGTHNEVDDDGNAVMQGIDQSKLVPLLTAALQEAIAKIETLEAKVAALEAQ